MFRKPRDDNSKDPLAAVIPSVGRPPTPPLTTASKKSKPPTLTSNSSSVHLFQSMQPQGRTTSTPIKSKGKGNQSILSFFKKDGLPQKASTVSVECKEDALFFGSEETTGQKQEDKPRDTSEPSQIPTPPSDHSRHWVDAPSEPVDDATRYNEIITPLKKRRTGATPMGFLRPKHGVVEEVAETSIVSTTEPVEEIRNQLDDEAKPVLRRELTSATTAEFFQYIGFDKDKNGLLVPVKEASEDDLIVERSRSTTCQPQDPPATTGNPISEPPPLKREPTSYIDLDGFEGLDDFIDDEFPEEGEEYQERQWMDEQFLKEQDMESDQDVDRNEPNNPKDANASEPCCPVCQASLVGVEDTVWENCPRSLDTSDANRMWLYTLTTASMADLHLCALLRKKSLGVLQSSLKDRRHRINGSNALLLRDLAKRTRSVWPSVLQLDPLRSPRSCLHMPRMPLGRRPLPQKWLPVAKRRTSEHVHSIRSCLVCSSVLMHFAMAPCRDVRRISSATFIAIIT